MRGVSFAPAGFNPWYVGGGVKRPPGTRYYAEIVSFNPWYVGGGVKRAIIGVTAAYTACFNPWYVGGGVKSFRPTAYSYQPG